MEKENHEDVSRESERLDRAGRAAQGQVNIIKSVRTILGFFVLVVLVVEGMGVVIVTRLDAGNDRTLLIAGMVVIIIALIAVVTYIAQKDPKTLLMGHSDGADNNATPSIVPHAVRGIVQDKNRIKIEGLYLAEGVPNEEINITYLSDDLYRLKHKIWEGVGLFDGEFYYGIYRYNNKAPREDRGNVGAHKAKLREGGGALNLHLIELGNKSEEIEYEYIWVRDIDGE